MAEKIFNARFAQKIDTLTAWASSNIVLKAGEIAFATESVDTTVDGVAIKQPIVLAKIGDGSKTFSQLPYSFYAKASDVHAWAKAAKAPDELDTKYSFALVGGKLQITETTYTDGVAGAPNVLPLIDVATQEELNAVEAALNTKIGDLTKLSTENKADLVTAINEVRQAVEVGGTGSVVTVGKVHDDTNKQTTYTVKQGGNAVAEAILVPDAYDDTALANRVKNIEDDYTTSSEFNGWLTNTYNTKVEEIEEAIEAAAKAGTDAAAAEKERAEGVEAGLAERLTGTEGVANAAKAAIDAFLDENAATDEVVNTLKEIQAGLDAGEASAASLLGEVNKIKSGETVVPKATHAVNADEATHAVNTDKAADSDKLGGQAPAYYATAQSVTDIVDGKTVVGKATADANGNVIADTYATKNEIETALNGDNFDPNSNLNPTSINGKISSINYTIASRIDPAIGSMQQILNTHGDIVTHNVDEFATKEQGAKADTAVQPEQLHAVATSGKLSDLDKTFGEGITDIIFDAGNASGYNA